MKRRLEPVQNYFERAILERISKERGVFTTYDLRDHLNIAYSAANKMVRRWLERGWIEPYGLVRNGKSAAKAFVVTSKVDGV